MRDWPAFWAIDCIWFSDIPHELATLFSLADELLCFWHDIGTGSPSVGCTDLAESFLMIPELLDRLNEDVSRHGWEFSAVANGPACHRDVCAPNTAILVLECVDGWFRSIRAAIGRLIAIDESSGLTIDRSNNYLVVHDYLPRVSRHDPSIPWLNSRDYKRMRCQLEQEVCRAFHRLIQMGRAVPERAPLTASANSRPSWNRELSKLTYGDQIAKLIRRLANATNVARVLDAFQEQGWPERIDDPLPGGANGQRLHETIRSVNTGLRFIRFRADGTGEGIIWEKVDQVPDASWLPPG